MTKPEKKPAAMAVMMLLSLSSLYAADDYGFNEYLGKVKSFFIAIGGGLLVISLALWAIKGLIKRNLQPEDWKSIGIMGLCGVLLIIGPQIITSVFSGLGGTDI